MTRKLLYIDDFHPDPMRGAGFPRSRQILNLLPGLGFEVTGFYTQQEGSILPEGTDFETVWISRPNNASKYLPVLKERLPHSFLVYDAEALFYLRIHRQAAWTGGAIGDCKEVELATIREADRVVTVSEEERSHLQQEGIEATVLSHLAEVGSPGTGFGQRHGLLFFGANLSPHDPNGDALLAFAKTAVEGLPVCSVAGQVDRGTFGAVTADRPDRFAYLGPVADPTLLYDRHRVLIAPHRFASGIPLKVIEAMANGLPSVITPLLAAQLSVGDGEGVRIAEPGSEFNRVVRELHDSESVWQSVQARGLELAATRFDEGTFRKSLEKILKRP